MKERTTCDFDCQSFDADKAALVFKMIAFHVNEAENVLKYNSVIR